MAVATLWLKVEACNACYADMKKDIKPVDFWNANSCLKAPRGMEGTCDEMMAYRGPLGAASKPGEKPPEGWVTCWHVPLWTRLKMLLTGELWLYVIGFTHPPIAIEAQHPFQKPEGLARATVRKVRNVIKVWRIKRRVAKTTKDLVRHEDRNVGTTRTTGRAQIAGTIPTTGNVRERTVYHDQKSPSKSHQN
jgi:hypothetical protein